MRLLQLHEYLALLDGGATPQPADEALSQACLQQAESIWPLLRLGSWTDSDRRIESVARCHAGGNRLVHVSAGRENCFLILVVPPRQVRAEAYLLFDIGAEYKEARFLCPAFGLDRVADEDTIRKYVPRLQGVTDPFAILETAEGTYIQTYADRGMFDVEHQLVSVSSHYCLGRRVDADTTVKLFLSYAFGNKEWAREFTWKKMEL
jgi:hypothetical protein